jgi:hypothetical protein
LRITYICDENDDTWESIEWRCNTPLRAINRNGRHSANILSYKEFVENSSIAQNTCSRSDILVLYKKLWGKTLSSIQHWMAQDKAVIVDFDEPFQLIKPENPDYDFIHCSEDMSEIYGKVFQSSPLSQFKWGIQIVSAATVPTRQLADDWAAYGQVEVIPDYIDLEQYREIYPQSHGTINLGWKGKSSQINSLSESGLLDALREVMEERPQARFVACCDKPEMFSDLGLPQDKTMVLPYRSYMDWINTLSWVDIGLIPLSGEYDQRLSSRIVLEHMILKNPWVASHGPAFHDFRPYGRLVDNKSDSWRIILLDMIDHFSEYKVEAAEAPYLFGLGLSIDENIHNVMGIYAKITNNLQEKLLTFPKKKKLANEK